MKDNEGIFNGVLWLCIRTTINLILIFVLVRGFVLGYTFSYKLFVDVPYMSGNNENVVVTIEESALPGDVADMLYEKRIIEDKKIFLARVYIGRYSSKIRTGDYVVNSTMSPDALCKMFCGITSEEENESE